MKGLAIKDVAARTGIAAGTIRMWEQRYGFPEPERTSAGYRVYSEDDVEALRRVLAYRERGLSVPAAIERARSTDLATDRPSLYGVLAAGDPPPRSQLLTKRTLIAVSRAIEDETISRAAAPVVVAAFQSEHNYRAVEHRYRAMARTADAVVVFADFERAGRGRRRAGRGAARARRRARQRVGGGDRRARLRRVPAGVGAAAGDRGAGPRADLRGDLDARRARGAPGVAGRRRRSRAGPTRALGDRMDALLDERPLALEQPAPALTAVTNRIVGYLDAG